jgi:hypothetical protein
MPTDDHLRCFRQGFDLLPKAITSKTNISITDAAELGSQT